MTAGTLNSTKTLNGPYGKFLVLTIDGKEYTLGRDVAPSEVPTDGTLVEYETRPNKQGNRYYVNKIRAITGTAQPTATATGSTGSPAVQTVRRADDPNKQMSVMFSYAKDLVAAGKVTVPVSTPDGIADIIGTTANALMRRFKIMTTETEASPTKGESFQG